MAIFSNRFRNKILQMTYKPSTGKKKLNPLKSIETFEKAINKGVESLLTEISGDDKDSKDKSSDKGEDKEKG